MAKKKINIKSVTSDVPSGDVNITYKNVRIAGLSESTTAVLETEDTICEDDIEVEYTKPTNTVNMPVYALSNTQGSTPSLLTTYSDAPGIFLKITMPSVDRVENVRVCDINNIEIDDAVPFYLDNDKAGNKIVVITTFEPATVDSAYNSIVIKYIPGA